MKMMDIFRRLVVEVNLMKVRDFSTSEGKFSVYDISKNVRGRGDMFTVLKDKGGYIVRNAFVPDELQRQGIATEFYKMMNDESIRKTGNPLRSTRKRKLSSGEEVHELSSDGIRLWDSLVQKGLAVKLGDKDYVFKK